MNYTPDKIEIYSLNCTGLRNKLKRQTLFTWLNQNKKGLIMLQETRSDIESEYSWKREIDGKIYFSHGSNSSRGVALLVPKKLNINVSTESTDAEGRILAISCQIENNPLTIISIYAPTKDNIPLQITFLTNLTEMVEKYSDKPLIIGGDFNTYLNPDLDKKGGISEQISLYQSSLLNFIDRFSLADIWGIRNKNKSQFSW